MPKDSAKVTGPMATGLGVAIGQCSLAGRKPENQDAHGAHVPEGEALVLKGITLAIADGISSSAVSGQAARTAVNALLSDYYATPETWSAKTAARRVILATNAWLHGRNAQGADVNAGQVCTLTALILKGREGHILHVGDSRVQRLAGQSLEPLTTDHRVVLSPDESYLGRAMGAEAGVDIDYRRVSLRSGDVFLLTTDGAHDHIEADDLVGALSAEADPDAAAARLCALALERGSTDNITVLIARIEALPASGQGLTTEATTLPLPPDLRAGDMLDGLLVLRQLQTTARSHVFLATDPLGRRVVVKIPARETAQDQAYLSRFALEDWILRRISSGHVLRAADPPERRSALYVATEFLEGVTLRQWMTDNPAPELAQVRDIIGQVAMGLRAMHRREMIHQDLRPENVMIDPAGTVRLIDLGSASVAGVEEAAPGILGDLPGTFQYTAPEYLSGDPVSWRSDQYALGVMAYEMLTGRLPYGAAVARVRSRRDLLRLSYQSARNDENGLPHWMDAALRRATQPDALRRYDALSEFVADLARPGRTSAVAHPVPLVQRNPLRFWQGLSAVLAVLCLILAVQLAG